MLKQSTCWILLTIASDQRCPQVISDSQWWSQCSFLSFSQLFSCVFLGLLGFSFHSPCTSWGVPLGHLSLWCSHIMPTLCTFTFRHGGGLQRVSYHRRASSRHQLNTQTRQIAMLCWPSQGFGHLQHALSIKQPSHNLAYINMVHEIPLNVLQILYESSVNLMWISREYHLNLESLSFNFVSTPCWNPASYNSCNYITTNMPSPILTWLQCKCIPAWVRHVFAPYNDIDEKATNMNR